MEPNGIESLVVKIDGKTKRAYKIACIDNKISMKDELTNHIVKYVTDTNGQKTGQ